MTRGQKILLGGLAFFAVLTLVLGYSQFRRSLSAPAYTAPENGSEGNTAGQPAGTADNNAVLRDLDTDEDGLSDWDELNTYKTSPYLPDSDSDGLSDMAEIDSGTDPNCPSGRECREMPVQEEITDTLPQTGLSAGDITELLKNSGSGAAPDQPATEYEALLQKIISGGGSPDELRRFMIDSGMDEATINRFTDQQLLDAYQQTMSEAPEGI